MHDDLETDLFAWPSWFPPHLRPEADTDTGNCRYLVHIPNLRLDGVRIPFRGGALRSLGIDEWSEVEQEVARKQRHAYANTCPAFFVVDSEIASLQTFKRVRADAHLLYSILLIGAGLRTDPPSSSMAYATRKGKVHRRVGPRERRSIVHGPVKYRFNADVASHIAAMLAEYEVLAGAFEIPEVARVIRVCGRIADADAQPIDDIMRLTWALEALLLKDITTGITAAFVKTVTALIIEAGEVQQVLEDEIRSLYALRSDALHGRDWSGTVAGTGRDEAALAARAHEILLRAVDRVVHQVGNAADPIQAIDILRANISP